MKKSLILYLILFLNPLASHLAREAFEYNKIAYNISNKNSSLYDTSFLITYSTSLLFNGFISGKISNIKYKILHLEIAVVGSSITIYIFNYIYKYNIVVWNIHAFFTSALWPVSFSLAIPIFDSPIIKCLWTLNGPFGEYIIQFINIKYNYLQSIFYILCFILNLFVPFMYKCQTITPSDNNINISLLNKKNTFNYTKLFTLIILSFNIKFITYSTSNWLPNIDKSLYNYYSLFSIFGTILVGIKSEIFKKHNILLILLTSSNAIIYVINIKINIINNNIIYAIFGILLSEISTMISILICEKNNYLVNSLSLMTSILDFTGTIGNSLLQLIVYNNLQIYLTISSFNLFLFSFILNCHRN